MRKRLPFTLVANGFVRANTYRVKVETRSPFFFFFTFTHPAVHNWLETSIGFAKPREKLSLRNPRLSRFLCTYITRRDADKLARNSAISIHIPTALHMVSVWKIRKVSKMDVFNVINRGTILTWELPRGYTGFGSLWKSGVTCQPEIKRKSLLMFT